MKAFVLHLFIELRTSFRRKQQMFLSYFFPIGFYLMMGAVMPQLNPMFLDRMIPAMMVFAAMTSTFLLIPDQITGDRESGVFRGYKINGITLGSIILIPAITSSLHVTVISAIILATAPLFFHAPVPENILNMFPVIWLTVFSFTGISLVIGTVSRSSRSAMMLSQIVFIPSMMIGGLMIPFSTLPQKLQQAAVFLPSSHSMILFSTYSFSDSMSGSPAVSLIILAASGTAGMIITARLFKWNPA